jgi:hypothetical protein
MSYQHIIVHPKYLEYLLAVVGRARIIAGRGDRTVMSDYCASP